MGYNESERNPRKDPDYMSSLVTESKEKMATRDGYGRALEALGEKRNFVVMCADLTDSTRTIYFRDKFPDRFIECGIAEANMMSVAAGIASTGTPVFASTYAIFAAGRAYDQVRNSIAYPHLNVKIGATHAGLSVGEDGATHQCLEDLSIMRVLPGMTVFSPCDGNEAKKCTEAALDIDGPVYIRLGRAASPIITSMDDPFEVGKGRVFADGKDITIVATGIMVVEAMKARAILESEGIDAAVLDIHTIKPIDEDLLVKYAKKTRRMFTVEEHSVIGGLGATVLEALSDKAPVPLTRIGVNDTFGRSGTVPALLDYYGLDGAHIAQKILASLKA